MANVLSQEEIDALLGGISEGTINTEGNGEQNVVEEKHVSPFDFTDQDHVLRGRMPTLEIIHDRFARLLRLSLSTSLRRSVEIQVCSQMLFQFGEYSQSLEKPHILHLLKLEPLKGTAMLVLPARIILNLVDLLFGGDGKSVKVDEERDFTLIEHRVIQTITEEIIRCYTEAWSAVFPVHIVEAGSETNLQFINIAQPSDPVNVVDCDVTIEGQRSSLSLCLPYAMIEPIKETLKGSFITEKQDRDSTWVQKFSAQLNESTVQLRVMLGSAGITVKDLLHLKPGDILQLNEDYEHPVSVLVEGVKKFEGTVGSHKSGRAIQVTNVVKGKEEKK